MIHDFKNKNILVLAPHTDDGELGCGGSISRMLEEGANVFYVAFSTAEQSLPEGFAPGTLRQEVEQATGALGIPPENLIVYSYEVRKLSYVRQEILEELVKIRRQHHFHLVLIPSLHDIHQDHTTVATEALRAFKTTGILGYELIWNNLTFDTTCFVRLEERHVEAKIKALSEYNSQAGRVYTGNTFIRALAITRGTQIGVQFAEAFEVVRWII